MSKFQLPPLYFDQGALPKIENCELPTEILQTVVEHLQYGDLAKLATLQRAWKTCLLDACSGSRSHQWKLANALHDGTDGLVSQPQRAMTLFHTLASVILDENGVPQPGSCNNLEHAASSMKKIGFYQLEQGDKVGLQWLECAFAANDTEAAHELALIYEYAKYGVETDVVKAAQWFEKAAQNGNIEAMAELGLCYELGCGVEANDNTALDWYMRAAQAGHVTAKFSVGEYFEQARGVPHNEAEACLWYYRAAVLGDHDSFQALKRLESIARIAVPGARALLDG